MSIPARVPLTKPVSLSWLDLYFKAYVKRILVIGRENPIHISNPTKQTEPENQASIRIYKEIKLQEQKQEKHYSAIYDELVSLGSERISKIAFEELNKPRIRRHWQFSRVQVGSDDILPKVEPEMKPMVVAVTVQFDMREDHQKVLSYLGDMHDEDTVYEVSRCSRYIIA